MSDETGASLLDDFFDRLLARHTLTWRPTGLQSTERPKIPRRRASVTGACLATGGHVPMN
jgi:hypothetical protein